MKIYIELRDHVFLCLPCDDAIIDALEGAQICWGHKGHYEDDRAGDLPPIMLGPDPVARSSSVSESPEDLP